MQLDQHAEQQSSLVVGEVDDAHLLDAIRSRAFDRIQRRHGRQAELREERKRRGILLAIDVPLDDGTLDDGHPLDPEYLRAAREADERRREAIAPTIDHKRTVTLFDQYGNERVITQPLAMSERFDPATIADPKKRANFEKWLERNGEAKANRKMTSMMEFACRVIDDELDAEKPKKARAPKKIEHDRRRPRPKRRRSSAPSSNARSRSASDSAARIAWKSASCRTTR